MVLLKVIGKLIRALRSAASPAGMGWGFALGAIAGLTPLFSLHNLLVLAVILIVNVNIASAMFGLAFYSAVALFLEPVTHLAGTFVLVNLDFLVPFWTSLYNAPVAPFTRFNHTVVMGGLLLSLVLLYPHAVLFRRLVVKYRQDWSGRVEKWKVVRWLKGSRLVRFYQRARHWGEV